MSLYLVFSGTSDHRERLFAFLRSRAISGFTSCRTDGGWMGRELPGDMLLFFCRSDAEKAAAFLRSDCQQESVPVLSLAAEVIQ